MKYESGLSYRQLKQIVDSDSIDTLSASVRQVGDRWQAVLNFQVADPSTKTGRRQVRITRYIPDVKASGRGKRTKASVERNELQIWKSMVVEDAKSLTGIRLDPTESVRACVESWIVVAQRRKSKPIRESTAANYRQIAKRIFRFPLADMQMIDLNAMLVQNMLDDLATGTDGRKGLSRKSVKDTHALLNIVCNSVLGADNNPCRLSESDGDNGIVLPDGQPTKRTRAGEINTLSATGIAKVMQLLDDRDRQADEEGTFDAMSLGARVTFNLGVRAEEASALRWQDVDLFNGKVRITHVIERTEQPVMDSDGQYVRNDAGNIKVTYIERDTAKAYADADRQTKTKKSRRTLEMSPEVAAILAKRKNEVAAEIRRMPRDERPSIGDLYILGGTDGQFLSPRALGKRWLKFATAKDIVGSTGDVLTFHGIRHSCGSRIAKITKDPYAVSRWMGHSSIATTEKYYFGLDEESLSEVSAAAADLINKRPDSGVIPINPHDRYDGLRAS